MGSEQKDLIEADYRLLAARVYEDCLELRRFASKLQADYGRWLVATVVAVHAGGVFLIASLDSVELAAKSSAIWALIWGLVLILLCGFTAWLNWGLQAKVYDEWSDPNMLINLEAWPKENQKSKRLAKWVEGTYWAATFLGVSSVACIPVSVWLLNPVGG